MTRIPFNALAYPIVKFVSQMVWRAVAGKRQAGRRPEFQWNEVQVQSSICREVPFVTEHLGHIVLHGVAGQAQASIIRRFIEVQGKWMGGLTFKDLTNVNIITAVL